MNNFVLELFDDQGQVCTFYTVRWEEATMSETDKFFQKFRYDDQFKHSLRELALFLEVVIGDTYGALEHFFRFENFAQALPPTGTYKVQDLNINFGHFPLRLYCFRVSETLVVLFNGAEKTANTAQGGKTGMVFQEANMFANRILEALRDKHIYITADQRAFKSFDGSDDILI